MTSASALPTPQRIPVADAAMELSRLTRTPFSYQQVLRLLLRAELEGLRSDSGRWLIDLSSLRAYGESKRVAEREVEPAGRPPARRGAATA